MTNKKRPSKSPNLDIYQLKNYQVETLVIESRHLKGNALRDTHIRSNPVIVPKKLKRNLPVVFNLAGYGGNGSKYFNFKTFEDNAIEEIDKLTSEGLAPKAIYVFVDAFSKWGGSQFINSSAVGKYEDYIVKELYEELIENYDVDLNRVAVTGGSSGGYGALHLASKFPDKFNYCAALAPDSFFAMSLLPEIYKALPTIKKLGGVSGIIDEIAKGRFFNRRDSFMVMNVIAMGLCYCPGKKKNQVEWPIDDSGIIISKTWKKWLNHDPLEFLAKRKTNLKKLKRIYIDVGDRDQFHLQYGARQLHSLLKKNQVPCDYSEFSGNHFDISDRRAQAWKWLVKRWR